jgi:hypothetical protein
LVVVGSAFGQELAGPVRYAEHAVFPRGEHQGAPVVIGYFGRSAHPPIQLKPVTREDADYKTPLGFLRASDSALKADDVEWALRNLRGATRELTLASFDDPQVRQRLRAVVKSLRATVVTREVVYGQYHVFFTESEYKNGRSSGNTALIFDSGEWFANGTLDRDVVSILFEFLGEKGSSEGTVEGNDFIMHEYLPPGHPDGKPLLLKYRGADFAPPLAILGVERSQAKTSSPEETVRALYSACKVGDLDWLVSLFLSDEAPKLSELARAQRDQVVTSAQRIDRAVLKSTILYGPYAIVLTQQFGSESGGSQELTTKDWFILKQVNGQWFLTNEFQDRMTEFFVGSQRGYPQLGPALPYTPVTKEPQDVSKPPPA